MFHHSTTPQMISWEGNIMFSVITVSCNYVQEGLCPRVTVQEGLCLEGLCPGGSLSVRPPCTVTNGSTVRILLKCILVTLCFQGSLLHTCLMGVVHHADGHVDQPSSERGNCRHVQPV